MHLHTNRSDGTLDPVSLVARATQAGIGVLSVTDHDTTAALDECAAEAARRGLAFIPGIEITAVDADHDIHVLGYFFDARSTALQVFLARQRADRIARVEAMARRLSELGLPIDVTPVFDEARRAPSTSVGRPQVAAALRRAGHVATIAEAFDRWIGTGRPAFVPRRSISPANVVELVAEAGGIASLAHPGLTCRDDIIAPLAGGGLAAIEVFHTDHDDDSTSRYLALATTLGTAVSGGSDYHGDSARRLCGLGRVHLPPAHFSRLVDVALARGCAVPAAVHEVATRWRRG